MMLTSAVTISVRINVTTILMATAVPVEISSFFTVVLTHIPTVAENQFKHYLIGCYLIRDTLNLAS